MALPSFLTLYSELISTPTISNVTNEKLDFSNKPLIDKLANWFEELGFKIEIQPVPNTRGKFNLLATYSNNENQTQGGLLLSGHTDTVPFDEGQWTKDPFKLTEENNKLYGLGTADMKGFFAFILDALRDIDLTKLTKPIYVLATADEETTMAGASFFAKNTHLQPDCTIIGEPTSLIPIRAHKGFISNSIKVIGKSGHSSDPDKGINAIEVMHLAIAQLLKLKQQFKERYHNDGFTVPYPTLNLGVIHGGDAANRICGCCELIIDIRVLPNNDVNSLYHDLCQALQPVMDKYPNRISVEYEVSPIPGYECKKDHPALQQVEKLVGQTAQTVNYSTEAPYLNQISPTIVLGPGSIEQAHQPDEFISMDFLKPTKIAIENLIKDFCL
ncbi:MULTISPECIES: acetylornithine deacetylase [unclassified Gilliamella]|uniref:acetylornithine deacetylase n=1 Tax=unclassified Gilliamella TaxID=2685620 RepID=UPI00226ABF78|nr:MULTISPECIES: acetylornithine deacetylase [unclassified Gilliamella]MCX8578602.1 acetylornithine deacetylase [Gilliamella sp. B2717]MCX8587229.1 acetylornithine deacetylase [Gilliamella sp. B3801]MCX8592016.1 acetylornithine deacetylase [Gilliamella sp. B3804]